MGNIEVIVFQYNSIHLVRKAKPAVKPGRKATGLKVIEIAGLPLYHTK